MPHYLWRRHLCCFTWLWSNVISPGHRCSFDAVMRAIGAIACSCNNQPVSASTKYVAVDYMQELTGFLGAGSANGGKACDDWSSEGRAHQLTCHQDRTHHIQVRRACHHCRDPAVCGQCGRCHCCHRAVAPLQGSPDCKPLTCEVL